MQNNQITIVDRDLNDSIVFLAKYGNGFWSYIRGEGTAVILVSGAILLIIAGAASSSDSHLHKPGWVYVCFALVVFFGAWIVTFFVCYFINIVSSLSLVLVFAFYVSSAWAYYFYVMYVCGDRCINSRRRTRCGLCRRRSRLLYQRVRMGLGMTPPSPSMFCRLNQPTSPPTDK